MHNAAIRASGVDAIYLAFSLRPDALAQGVAGLDALGVQGFNVTIPHKEVIGPYLNQVDELAEAVGAVNTVTRYKEGLSGTNTDVRGILDALARYKVSSSGASIFIVGAGGAARACAYALSSAGSTSIAVANRTPTRARRLVRFIETKLGVKAHATGLSARSMAEWVPRVDLVVNATPIDTASGSSLLALSLERLRAGAAVFDMVYRPLWTPLLESARRRGAICVPGFEMLAAQGAASFRIWTGIDSVTEVMRRSLMRALQRRSG
jgi:shikimate dehydrogenase